MGGDGVRLPGTIGVVVRVVIGVGLLPGQEVAQKALPVVDVVSPGFGIAEDILVGGGEVDRRVFPCVNLLPDDLRNEVVSAEHFVADFSQACLLVVVYADENHAVGMEELSCQQQPGVYHAAPIRVEPAVGIRIPEQAAAVLVPLSDLPGILLRAHGIVILIEEIPSRVEPPP